MKNKQSKTPTSIKRKYILCDIDHTLANAFWRDDMIGGEGGWEAYHAADINDEPLHDMVNIINSLHDAGFVIIGLTARPSKWRKQTMEWLLKHSVKMDELLMRTDDAFHPSPEMKMLLVFERFNNPAAEVAAIFDDREDVISAFKAKGITALQVHGRQR